MRGRLESSLLGVCSASRLGILLFRRHRAVVSKPTPAKETPLTCTSEIWGSAFMKSASVFLGLVTGLIIAAATGYFNSSIIKSAPAGTFLWVHTWKLHIRGQLVLPMIAAWAIIVGK
jgi:hypothetical protein